MKSAILAVPLGSDTAKIQTIQRDIVDTKSKAFIWCDSDCFDLIFDASGNEKTQDTAENIS
ncbi:hypothetical protein [Shewanella sp.]|uniref:hypothetical protein n=1 Tax=Shewanella sp. TaxID=50422 RepID=UPI002628BD28|nr:hypothetical protein [Shewanella sp.]